MDMTISTPIKKNTTMVVFSKLFFVLLWSSGAIVIEFGLRYVTPLTFLFYRFLFAVILMACIVLVTRAPWPKDWCTIHKTIAVGLLTQFSYIGAYFFALYKGVSPTVMTIFLGLQPMLTALIGNVFLKYRIKIWQYLGLVMGLIGVFLSIVHDFKIGGMTEEGLLYAIACVLSITVGSVIQKNNAAMDLRTGSLMQFIASLIPITILNSIFGSFYFPVVTGFILPLSWMVLVVSVGATCLYYKLLRAGSAVAVNSLFYLVPAITAVLCYFIFTTPITIYVGLGVLFILSGVWITQRNS